MYLTYARSLYVAEGMTHPELKVSGAQCSPYRPLPALGRGPGGKCPEGVWVRSRFRSESEIRDESCLRDLAMMITAGECQTRSARPGRSWPAGSGRYTYVPRRDSLSIDSLVPYFRLRVHIPQTVSSIYHKYWLIPGSSSFLPRATGKSPDSVAFPAMEIGQGG